MPNEPDDVITIVDVSRGGVKFTSDIVYRIGMWVELASNYRRVEITSLFQQRSRVPRCGRLGPRLESMALNLKRTHSVTTRDL